MWPSQSLRPPVAQRTSRESHRALSTHQLSALSSIHTKNIATMPVDFYTRPASAPCRAVALTAKALGVSLTEHQTILRQGDHLTPEYLRMNPQHTIPTINDDGFCLWESRAIQQYLADKYAKNDDLYPKDVNKRAIVNQRLYFDMGTLYQRFSEVFYPMMRVGAPKDAEKAKKLEEALAFLEGFLAGSKYAAGDKLTIADHSLVASISTLDAVGVDLSRYPNIKRWYADCQKSIEGYEELNGAGVKQFGDLFKSMVKDA